MTRRDLIVALMSACVTLGALALLRWRAPVHGQGASPQVMGSSVWDWNSIEVKPTKIGSTRKFFQAPTATLDELECHVTTLNPGETPHPPHQHPDEEIIVIKEGTVEALVNGQTRRVGPGSVILQASNQPHSIRNVGKTPATYHVFKWNSPGMLRK
jgi:quercetin dioxygenase-like cupin family protein